MVYFFKRLFQSRVKVVTATSTVDVSQYDFIIVATASAITVTLDFSGCKVEKMVNVKVYTAGNIGQVTLTANQGVSLQTSSGNYKASVVLTQTRGNRSVDFLYNGSNADNISNTLFADDESLTDFQADHDSGFDSVTDETNKPTGQLAGWPWQRITVKNKNSTGTLARWRTELVFHTKTGAWFERFWDDQTASFSAWFRVHTNRWFPVNESMTPANNEVLTYNATTGVWENKSRQSAFTVTANTYQAVTNSVIITNNTSQKVVITLPTNANSTIGDPLTIGNLNGLGWTIAQNASDQIIGPSSKTTAGTGGSLSSTGANPTVSLRKVAANTWQIFANEGSSPTYV